MRFHLSDSDTTILIVDDSIEDRATYIRYLQSDQVHSYNFLEAGTLEEGIDLWRSQHPDIVLIDYFLPDGEGLELLTEMGKDEPVPKLAAIVLTGYQVSEQILIQAMRLGATDYLKKGDISAISLCNRVGQVRERITVNRQLQRSQQQEIVVSRISLQIRQYLDLEEISNAIVQEIRVFLNADRSVIYMFNPDMSGMVVAESILPPWESCLHRQLSDEYFPENMGGEYRNGRMFVTPDIYQANLSQCHLEMLEQFPTRASLIVPILRSNDQANPLWGLLCTYQCFEPRLWDEADIRLLQQLSVQFAIALQQAELYRNLQISNAELENRVAERTAELFKRQQEFIALVENSPNITMRLDRQMRHIYVNPVVEKKSGIPVEDFLGKTGREMGFPEKNVTMLESAAQRLLETGEEQRFEIEQPLTQGKGITYYQTHLIPEYAPDGEIVTMLLVFYDITQNRLNEIAITEANRRWQSLLDNVRLIVVGLNDDGLVQYANPFFLDATGYKLEEVIGKHWFAHFLPQIEQEKVIGDFSDSLLNPDHFHKYYQNSIVTKTGEEK